MSDLGFAAHDWESEAASQGGGDGSHWLEEPSKLYAEFFLDSVKDVEKSELQNRPIFHDKLHVRVFMPGGDIMTRLAEKTDRYRFPHAWDHYRKGNTEEIHGTPLKEWPPMTPGILATLNAANIFNVEGLSELSDAMCEDIGSVAYEYRDRAKKFLESTSGHDAEMDALKNQNAELAEQMKALQDQIAKMSAPKRRGRRPKVKNVPSDDHTGSHGPPEPAKT